MQVINPRCSLQNGFAVSSERWSFELHALQPLGTGIGHHRHADHFCTILYCTDEMNEKGHGYKGMSNVERVIGMRSSPTVSNYKPF
jgi:hypothetical protein